MNFTQSYVKSSIQRALLGAVTENLRAVTVKILATELELFFYYESKPTEKEIDLSQVVATEVFSDFIDVSIEEHQILLPLSQPIPTTNENMLVYYRYEGNYKNKNKNLYDDETLKSIYFASQQALLGGVTINIRAVSVTFIDKNIYLYFYYDKEPIKEEVNLSEIIMQNILINFEGVKGNVKRFVIPEPERILLKECGIWLYWRYEEYLIDD